MNTSDYYENDFCIYNITIFIQVFVCAKFTLVKQILWHISKWKFEYTQNFPLQPHNLTTKTNDSHTKYSHNFKNEKLLRFPENTHIKIRNQKRLKLRKRKPCEPAYIQSMRPHFFADHNISDNISNKKLNSINSESFPGELQPASCTELFGNNLRVERWRGRVCSAES